MAARERVIAADVDLDRLPVRERGEDGAVVLREDDAGFPALHVLERSGHG